MALNDLPWPFCHLCPILWLVCCCQSQKHTTVVLFPELCEIPQSICKLGIWTLVVLYCVLCWLHLYHKSCGGLLLTRCCGCLVVTACCCCVCRSCCCCSCCYCIHSLSCWILINTPAHQISGVKSHLDFWICPQKPPQNKFCPIYQPLHVSKLALFK